MKKLGFSLAALGVVGACTAVFIELQIVEKTKLNASGSKPSSTDKGNSEVQAVSKTAPTLKAENDFGISLIATSVQDKNAVLNIDSIGTRVVSLGDQVGSDNLTVLQVSGDKIVLRGKLIEEVYFVYLKKGDSPSRVQKISNVPHVSYPPIATVGTAIKED